MPLAYTVDVAANLLRVRRWGRITAHEEEKACRQRACDPLVVPGIQVLVDCKAVEPADTTEMVRSISDCTRHIGAALQCGPLAIVVDTEVQYGMARMYQAYTDSAHPITQVFRVEADALEWLALQ